MFKLEKPLKFIKKEIAEFNYYQKRKVRDRAFPIATDEKKKDNLK
jgi:hypothetical protein